MAAPLPPPPPPGWSHGHHEGNEEGHDRAVRNPAAREAEVAEAMVPMKAIKKDRTKQFTNPGLVRLKWRG